MFTTKPERMAPVEEQKSFEEQVAASAVPKQLGDVKLEDLPGPEVLLTPGKSTVTFPISANLLFTHYTDIIIFTSMSFLGQS